MNWLEGALARWSGQQLVSQRTCKFGPWSAARRWSLQLVLWLQPKQHLSHQRCRSQITASDHPSVKQTGCCLKLLLKLLFTKPCLLHCLTMSFAVSFHRPVAISGASIDKGVLPAVLSGAERADLFLATVQLARKGGRGVLFEKRMSE